MYYREIQATDDQYRSTFRCGDSLEHLVRGEVGTVVEIWAPGVYEVEFADRNGRAYAMAAIKADQLMLLHFEPVNQAA